MLNELESNAIYESRILVVDDAEFNRIMIRKMLNSHGFNNIQTAVDGEDALEKIKESVPDVIVLDLMMPKLDGIGVCKALRSDPKYAFLPILIQTAMTDADSKAAAFDAGANDLINKPIDIREMVSRVKVHLANRYMMNELQSYHSTMQYELTVARSMLDILLPTPEKLARIMKKYNVEIEFDFLPSNTVGGDFCGLAELSERRLGIYTIDFVGHGVAAAINVFRFQQTMKDFFGKKPFHTPAEALEHFNHHLQEMLNLGQYATIFYAIFDKDDDRITYASSGMPCPILMRDNDDVVLLENEGIPVGLTADSEYENNELSFHKGDILMAYSDVILETEGKNDDALDEEDVVAFLKIAKNAEKITHSIREQFVEKVGISEFEDDYTVVTLKRG